MALAVVSGSASGIGAAVRSQLEGEGFTVIGIDLRDAEIEADLSTPDGRVAAIDAAIEKSGGTIDRLVLCAGLGAHLDDYALIASVNYFGAVELLDGLKDAVARGSDPSVVVISSNSAQFGPFADHPFIEAMLAGDEPKARELVSQENGFLAYGGSKHAVARAVRRRAKAFGDAGVRLNAIAPGPIETPLLQGSRDHPVFGKGVDQLDIPLGRTGKPEEIASAICWMLGDGAAFMHGSVIYVDGGNDATVRPDGF